jgi:hypothetical protein
VVETPAFPFASEVVVLLRGPSLVAGALLLVALPALAASGRLKVAVLSPTAAAGIKGPSYASLGEVVAAELGREARLEVTTQGDLLHMLDFERQRQLLDCPENQGSCIAELGGALGVDFVVGTQIGRVGATTVLSLSLISIQKARTVQRFTAELAGDDELVRETRRGTQQLRDALSARLDEGGGSSARPLGFALSGVALAAGAGLLASAWWTHGTYADSVRGGQPSLTWPEAQGVELRAQIGLGCVAAGLLGGAALLLLGRPASAPATTRLFVLPTAQGVFAGVQGEVAP